VPRPDLIDPTPAAADAAWFHEQISRRRAIQLICTSVIVAAVLPLEACSSAPAPSVWVTLEVDSATLTPDLPVQAAFSLPSTTGGAAEQRTLWLVKQAGGSLVAFDPRCTHLGCAYAWTAADDAFDCRCHKARFDVDGRVLSGPPPRPLDRFPTRVAAGALQAQVPGDLPIPRGSA
jgi:quinol---cytochrome c reductase iron-sulfur subunit, bacillus type